MIAAAFGSAGVGTLVGFDGACRLAGPVDAGCTFFRFLSRRNGGSALAPSGPIVAAPAKWSSLDAAGAGFLAARGKPLRIDRLDDRGRAETLFEDDDFRAEVEHVVEIDGGLAVVSIDGGRRLTMTTLLRGADGRYARGATVPLPMSAVNPDNAPFATARTLSAPLVSRSFDVLSASPETGKGLILAVIRLVLPASVPPSKAHVPIGLQDGVRRSLVVMHVRPDGKVAREIDLGRFDAPGYTLSRQPGGGYSVHQSVLDAKLSVGKGKAEPHVDVPAGTVPAWALEQVKAAAFDVSAREGVVIAGDATGRAFAVPIDPAGAPVGTPTLLDRKDRALSAPSAQLARTSSGWVLADGAGLMVLTGPSAGTMVDRTKDEQGSPTVVIARGQQVEALFLASASDADLTAAGVARPAHRGPVVHRFLARLPEGRGAPSIEPTRLLADFYTQSPDGRTVARVHEPTVIAADGAGGIVVSGYAEDGAPIFARRSPDGVWSKPITFKGGAPFAAAGLGFGVTFDTWQPDTGPLMVRFGDDGSMTEVPSKIERSIVGPILGGRFVVGPAHTVFPLPEALTPSILDRCRFALATGPRAVTLLCQEPASAEKAGLRAVSRVVHH
ncbi:hypothetical protein A7982_13362 [Minicystis rosea]|nr:hypothetical protein A7982_13362 [Minicystis rosea]